MKKLPLLGVTLVLLVVGLSAHAAFGRWFRAELKGSSEVPPVTTSANGSATVHFNRDLTSADFRLRVHNGTAITQAHLHCGAAGENGPVVAHLFGNIPGGFNVNGTLSSFTLTSANITSDGATCSPAITTMAQFAQAAREGKIYANVHSVAHPAGEIRGQLHE